MSESVHRRGPALGQTALIAVAKVAAFAIATQLLIQLLVFNLLGSVSARYWSAFDGRGLNEPWFLASALVILAITLGVSYFFLRLVDRKSWAYLRLSSSGAVRRFGLGFAVAITLVAVFAIIQAIGSGQSFAFSSQPFSRMILYLLLALCGGLALVVYEELLYRGYVLRTLEESAGRPLAVIVTAALFGMGHLARANASVIGILNVVLMGALLAEVCIRWDSLWVSIGLHFGWNLGLLMSGLPISGVSYPDFLFRPQHSGNTPDGGLAFGPEESLIVTALISLLIIGALVWGRRGAPVSREA